MSDSTGLAPRDRVGRRSWPMALAVVAALLVVGVLAAAMREPGAALQPGEAAPAFALATFDGDRYRLSDLRGSVVVLNFWASWCIECGVEAADLEAVWRAYKDRGVIVLGVDYTDTEDAALAYLERFEISYPNGPDLGGRISARYGLTGVPETIVIDRAGRVAPLQRRDRERPVAKMVGPIVPGGGFTPQDLRALLDRLLSAAQSRDDALPPTLFLGALR